MKKQTKIQKVEKYLLTHKKGITQRDAALRFDAYRLASIIFVLRKRYDIETIDEYTEDGTRYARYVMRREGREVKEDL